MKTKKWFLNNIGKRIYRDKSCDCNSCKMVEENGLIIYNKLQAEYVYWNQNEYLREWIDLNYRLTK